MGQVEHIMQETQILSKISHPFVTNKFAGFVTPSNLLLVMEFCPGGDLFDQLYKHKAFTVPDTRIFVSQVIHTCTRACIRTCMHTFMNTCMHTCMIRACTHAYTHAWAGAAPARVPTCDVYRPS